MDTMSVVSGSVVGGKKKRPRKSKGKDNDTASVSGRKAKSTISADVGRGKRRASRDATAEEDEEEGGDVMALNMDTATKEQRDKDEYALQVLRRVLQKDDAQFTRYEAWRSAKFSDAVTRRIVNQTLSQSVPANVVLAMRSVTKIFAGEIIEGARKVQTEWLEKSGESQTGLPSPPAEGNAPVEKEKRRGPLHPDHLREAFRRHLMEADGGLVGQLGLWQLQNHSGVERFAVKVQGKRLFK